VPLHLFQAFLVEWHGPKIAIKALNGKYVTVLPNGALKAESDTMTEECMYIYEIVNRPKLVLRGEQGFMGVMPSGAVCQLRRFGGVVFLGELRLGDLRSLIPCLECPLPRAGWRAPSRVHTGL